jgi:hypothetical protein
MLKKVFPIFVFFICLAAQKGYGQDNTGAQTNPPTLPPLADITAWITSTLPAQIPHPSKPILLEGQEIKFEGCKATFTDTFLKYKTNDRPPSKRAVSTTVVDLSTLTPDSVRAVPAETAVQLHSDRGFPVHTRDWLTSVDALLRHETEPDQPTEDDEVSPVFGYYVESADMATRTAHAWHDAIVRCAAKSVPNNLY